MDLTSFMSSLVSLILYLMNFLACLSFFFFSTNCCIFCSIYLSSDPIIGGSSLVDFTSIYLVSFLDYTFDFGWVSVVCFSVYYNGLVATGGTYSLVASTMAKFSVSIGLSGFEFESLSWFSAVWLLVVVLFLEPNIAWPMFIRKDPINFSYSFAFI